MRQITRNISLLGLITIMASVASLPRASSGDDATPEKQNARASSPNVRVTEVYPSSDVLPENLLRFYVYFSRAMKREDALASIKLLDCNGMVIDGAFLSNKFDLWSPDGTRLTLLFDPGRVKTGLVAHNELGRALEANRNYELVIDSSLLAVDGSALSTTHRKSFRVSKADFEAPDVDRWRLKLPESGSRNALSVTLNGPHDHVSLAYRIRVKDDGGATVVGRIGLSEHESVWRFVPSRPWKSSSYTIKVDPLLEDVAGNRITGLFEKPFVEDKNWWSKPKTITFHPVVLKDRKLTSTSQ